MDKEKVESLFRYAHLPEDLQKVSKPFHDMALNLVQTIPRNPELTLSIRALWESKNLAVYAFVASQD